MPKKQKNELETSNAKSRFSLRKRIKKVANLSEKTTDIRIVSKTNPTQAKDANGDLVSIERTTLEFQHAYGTLNNDPKYAKNLFISNYDKIINSQDFVGIDFIAIQTFIAKNSPLKAEVLVNEVRNFLKFLWTFLYTKSNVEITPGVKFEVIEVAGLIVPVVNSGLPGQTITKQTVKLKEALAVAVKKGLIDGKAQTLNMIELFFKTLVESAQFGYVIEINDIFLFRRESGSQDDLALIPGKEFFNGQSVMRQSNAVNRDRGTAKAVTGFVATEEK